MHYAREEKGIHIRKPRSNEELIAAFEIFKEVSYTGTLPYSFERGLMTFPFIANNGGILRVILKDSVVRGIFLASETPPLFCPVRTLNQQFFQTNLKGTEAVRAIKLTHALLIKEAEARKIQIVISQSSWLDSKFTLVRVLERLGWVREGYMAVWKTSHHKGSKTA